MYTTQASIYSISSEDSSGETCETQTMTWSHSFVFLICYNICYYVFQAEILMTQEQLCKSSLSLSLSSALSNGVYHFAPLILRDP